MLRAIARGVSRLRKVMKGSPKGTQETLFGTTIGLTDHHHPTVGSREDVERELGLPVLATYSRRRER